MKEKKVFFSCQAYHKLHSGTCERRPLTAEEGGLMMRAIDSRQQDPFGIRKLVTVEVDGLHATPRHVRGEAIETPTTLVSYAAWRRRDGQPRRSHGALGGRGRSIYRRRM